MWRKAPHTMTVPTLGLSVDQVAQATGLSKAWLDQLRCAKKGPAYLKVGHRVLYRPADVEAWLSEHIQQPKAA